MQVAFYKSKHRPVNRLIAWWLAGDYSHVELVLGQDAAGNSVCASSSMMDGGVRVKHMRLNPEHWDVLDVAGDVGQAWAWLQESEGQPYDYFGLLGQVARFLGHRQKRWLCHEAVAAMLGFGDPHRLDPCALYVVLARETSGVVAA